MMRFMARWFEPKEPHIARDYMLNGTHVRIATNFCEDKTPEDVQEILNRVARIALRAFAEAGKYVVPKEEIIDDLVREGEGSQVNT